MKTTLIEKAYSVDAFKKEMPQLMDMIATQLERSRSQEQLRTIDRLPPEEQLRFWRE